MITLINYLTAINIIGFILFAINTHLYRNSESKKIDTALTIASLLGGSVGIVIGILIIDRKARKETMMSRVFISTILVIQIVLLLFFTGQSRDDITFKIGKFLEEYKWIIAYFLVINIITFIVFAIDKYRAVKNRWRIRIVTLLILSFIGGSLGGLMAMKIFKHKTKVDYFTVGLKLMLIMQIIMMLYLYLIHVK